MFGLFGSSSSKGMDDELLNLKMTAKQFKRESKKAEKEIEKAKEQVKQAINKDRLDIAREYSNLGILHKKTSAEYLRLAVRMEAVATKLEVAIKTKKVTNAMGQITKTMGKALQSMNLTQIQENMDKFEKAVEDIDVMSATVTGAMESSTAGATPASEVDDFMRMVAEENGLDAKIAMPAAGKATGVKEAEPAEEEEDDLARRLAQLKPRS